MPKICPNCNKEWPDEFMACPLDGTDLIPKPQQPAGFSLNLGDANAISGGLNINQSKNITSHDVHYHTVQERNKSEKELLQDRQNQYHDTVAKLLKGGVITVEARAQLDKLKFNLGLDDSIAANIEATVKNEQKTQARAGNDGLSVIGKMALKSAVAAVEENSPQVQSCIVKLAPVCKTTMNEQVHFYYSMLLAASDPQRCVEAYEKRTIDSYWLSYWASVAYRKLGNEMEAEGILTEMTGLWQERPEINVVINACLGIWLSCSGSLAECQETIIEYLTQTEEVPSEELNDLFHALLHAVGVEEEDNARFAFYNEHFLMVLNEEAELKKAQEAYDNKDYETALSIWNQLTERNNAEAIRKTGICFQLGKGVIQNYSEAIKMYHKAADLGCAIAFGNLGVCYMEGLGVVKDPIEGFKWFKKAADEGSAEGMNSIGRCYMDGVGVAQDKLEGFKWLKKSADLGCTDGMVSLGRAYMCGEGTTENPQEAIKWWHKAADLGNARAMNNMGSCYDNGSGVTQDKVEAVKWYRKAADLGIATAMNNLGLCYDNGSGVIQDKAEAFKWYRKAADLGHAGAMNLLGTCYSIGDGVTEDVAEAVKWYRKAADMGNVRAMANLGDCYRDGSGVTQDPTEAVKWYRKAADLGDVDAMRSLGDCYLMGRGEAKNASEAFKWFKQAADLGNTWAMCNIGTMYRRGWGCAQNLSEAVIWYNKGIALGGDNNITAMLMRNLGDCYLHGLGVTMDQTEALKWYNKALELNPSDICIMIRIGDCYYVNGEFCESENWYSKAADLGHRVAMARMALIYYSMGDIDEAQQWEKKALDNGYREINPEDVFFSLELVKAGLGLDEGEDSENTPNN